ncbi:YwiC-like family protein [Archangium violaceum]|uniref:YwiC-like family protein n=1 Tax=Archangium violaceum TaxID=83451 RepID=UPI00193B7E19|nr:YwiC-like family protein [Archangium violaceum]QRK10342.1 YwiC-like family protein [Archangium violaceum]
MSPLSTHPAPGPLLQGLLPREHGVWFQLGLPLVTALFVSGAPASALWLSGAALACLLAHEPLVLLLGHRGARRGERDGGRARTWGLLVGAVGAVCFALGALTLPPEARPFLAMPLILGGEVLLLVWNRQERTLSGEVLASLALGAWAVPVAMAGGMPASTAMTLWGTYGLSFALATLAVRLVIASHRPRAHRTRLRCTGAVLVTALLATAVLWALDSGLHPLRVVALLPVGLVALGLCVALPSPRRLHSIGWTLGVAGTLTLVLLGVGLS